VHHFINHSEMTQMTHDQALEQFHADMTHSINHADRAFATYLLAKRIGDAARAERMAEAWMVQHHQTLRQLRG
jgi:hypothetical protein